jgi:hypothetical protein
MADRHTLRNRSDRALDVEGQLSLCQAGLAAPDPNRTGPASAGPPISVPGIGRDIQIKIASEWDEWKQALELLATSYRGRGYEISGQEPYRFTPSHALPGTIAMVAQHEGRVVATMTFVPDNSTLGLPLESIYGEEIARLRGEGRRMGEAISLADTGLTSREFIHVFKALIKLGMQYHESNGGDTFVIVVNPRHSRFYQKVLGFTQLGLERSYPTVQNHPGVAFVLDIERMRTRTPDIYREVFGERLPVDVLTAPVWSAERVRYFGCRSSQTDAELIDRLVLQIEDLSSPLRRHEAEEWPKPLFQR